jgi:UDP-glucose 4-epimerase
MARILITGGAGYVGSHCAKALSASGHEGIVFDNLLFGQREFVRWGELVEGDIRDAAALDAVFNVQFISGPQSSFPSFGTGARRTIGKKQLRHR